MSRLPSVLAIVLGAVAAFAPPLVAFVPPVGANTIYRFRLLRTALAAAGVALALAAWLRRPCRGHLATLPLTLLLGGLTWLFDPPCIFIALDHPPHVPASQAALGAGALVLGLELATAACAWPLEMVVPHHLVNDTVGRTPVLASY